ncbi:MAG: CoA-binding protein [Candidatus Thermoplasmatota archaeon]|nr:CoA-binding protein [Candidatus Thermoplasmatota archaeon]
MARVTDQEEIRDVVRTAAVVAIVGISKNEERASYHIADRVRRQGYTMYYVNPKYAGETIFGERILPSLQDVPEHVDIVDVFRNPKHVEPIIEAAVAIDADVVWLQPGAENMDAIEAHEQEIDIVFNACLGVAVGQLDG